KPVPSDHDPHECSTPALLFLAWPDCSDPATSRSGHQARDSQRAFSIDAHEITTGVNPSVLVSFNLFSRCDGALDCKNGTKRRTNDSRPTCHEMDRPTMTNPRCHGCSYKAEPWRLGIRQ